MLGQEPGRSACRCGAPGNTARSPLPGYVDGGFQCRLLQEALSAIGWLFLNTTRLTTLHVNSFHRTLDATFDDMDGCEAVKRL